jgi:hypothetical protein
MASIDTIHSSYTEVHSVKHEAHRLAIASPLAVQKGFVAQSFFSLALIYVAFSAEIGRRRSVMSHLYSTSR